MKCNSCSEEVPSKFAHAIATNVCPLCGQQIMEPALQKVLNSLRDAMLAAISDDYQQEAFDWLSSNFNLLSKDSDEYQNLVSENSELQNEIQELKNRHVKPTPKSAKNFKQEVENIQIGTDAEGHQVQLQGESIQDPERTQVFLERAQANKMAGQSDHFRKIINQIKKSGSSGASEGGGSVNISPEMLGAASADEVEEMEAMLSGGIPGISSSLGSSDSDDDDELPPIAQSLIAMGGAKSQSGDYNPRDVAKLQELQAKASRASKALDRGGSAGIIRRS